MTYTGSIHVRNEKRKEPLFEVGGLDIFFKIITVYEWSLKVKAVMV
jgi:hypothetical protein